MKVRIAGCWVNFRDVCNIERVKLDSYIEKEGINLILGVDLDCMDLKNLLDDNVIYSRRWVMLSRGWME